MALGVSNGPRLLAHTSDFATHGSRSSARTPGFRCAPSGWRLELPGSQRAGPVSRLARPGLPRMPPGSRRTPPTSRRAPPASCSARPRYGHSAPGSPRTYRASGLDRRDTRPTDRTHHLATPGYARSTASCDLSPQDPGREYRALETESPAPGHSR